MGVKAPVHRTLGTAKTKIVTTNVMYIDAGSPATTLLVAISPMSLIMPRLRDCRSRGIRVARLRSLVLVYTLRAAKVAETIETTICAVARLFETNESNRPVERVSVTVLTSSGRMLANTTRSLPAAPDCQAKGGWVEEALTIQVGVKNRLDPVRRQVLVGPRTARARHASKVVDSSLRVQMVRALAS